MSRLVLAKKHARGLKRLIEACKDWLAGAPKPKVAPKARIDETDETANYRQMAFTFAVIALSAKLVRVGGEMTRDAFLAFRRAFPLEDEDSAKIRDLFRMAWEDSANAEAVARQVMYLYPNQPELWREMLSLLVVVAQADGPLTAEELRLLTAISEVFGYNRARMGRLIASVADGRPADPLKVLGLKRGAAPDEIKARYRSLMRRYHPDVVAARLHYPEAVAVAEQKAVAISNAYKELVDA
jgi:DnaJ like chaperone protein